ncbi:MAG: hypothetical protein PCFJNLEI_01408 [Verrucomicrobiae bacterium]|nr:hypothetical protein [Verrucomicrobiae bacterium]
MKATLLILLAAGAAAHATETADLASARLALGKWVETQQIIAREKRDWQQGKEILIGRLELLRGEIAGLQEKLKKTEGGTTDVDQKKVELLAQNDSLKALGATMLEAVTGLEGQVRQLHQRLPEPLQEKIKPLYDRMPADAGNTKVSLAERYQNVLGILNELTKLNNEVTLVSEIRTLAGGQPAEVKTVYVGLAQAYFVSGKGEAGIGRPTPTGWQWEAANSLAPAIFQAIEVLQGKAHPQFVSLPVKIKP